MESRVTRALRLPCWHDGNHVVVAQIEADERHFVAHQPDLLEPSEHLLDAAQPGHRLLILTVGIGKGKIDARLHRLALPHFVEQAVHRSEEARYARDLPEGLGRGGVLTSST